MLSDESTAKFEIELVNKQVQKIKQAKKDCQTHYSKQLGCGTCKALQLCMWIDGLVDTIEAMRKHIEALQQENEQLKADCDRMLGEVQELTMECNHFKERLQISPYGDDKIDELDEALENCKFQYEQLKQENERLRAQVARRG